MKADQYRQEIEKALAASIIFPLLRPAERARFIASARSRSYRSRQTIFRMGDPGDSMMVVETGEVRITFPAEDGRMAVLGELGAGAVFGEIALLDGGPRSAEATAITNCSLLVFERRVFMEMLRENWSLTEAVLKLVCARVRRSDARMAEIAFLDLSARLARTLIERARAGPKGGPPKVNDSQGALAVLAGGSRENVNRWLRKWQKEGLVAIAGGRISILDVEGLRRATR